MPVVLSANVSTAVTLIKVSNLVHEPIIFPTDTIYGIGAPITSLLANKKIFKIKNRGYNQPLPILISTWKQLERLAKIDEKSLAWLKENWLKDSWLMDDQLKDKQLKGCETTDVESFERYTVVVEASDYIKSLGGEDRLYTKDDTVAIRMVPMQSWLGKAIAITDTPMTATSVNISGDAPTLTVDAIVNKFKSVNYILWGEAGDKPSSIVSLKGGIANKIR